MVPFFSVGPDISIRANIENTYKACPECGGHLHVRDVDKDLFNQLNQQALRIANSMFANTWDWNQVIDPALTKLVAEHLAEGVIDGFGTDFIKLDYGTKDWKMLANLEKNVYQFSAAKNYHQLKEMTRALKDADGNLRPFSEFVKEVSSISKIYNQAWLATEYNTAQNGAILAARWNDIQENKDVLPSLQYETVGDDRVREDHAALDGVVRPVDDDFWSTWYPPNGFNCRCTVLQVLETQRITPTERIQYPDIPPMFRVNLAKKQLAFPPDHPYWDMKRADRKAVSKEALKLTPDRTKPATSNQ